MSETWERTVETVDLEQPLRLLQQLVAARPDAEYLLEHLGVPRRSDGFPRWRTRDELRAWLETPRGADGRTPLECLAAGDLDRLRALALSVPSAHLTRAPSWVRSPVAPRFHAGAEHMQEPPARHRRALSGVTADQHRRATCEVCWGAESLALCGACERRVCVRCVVCAPGGVRCPDCQAI